MMRCLQMTARVVCRRRVLAILIGLAAVSVFVQQEWIIRTSYPFHNEFMLDWSGKLLVEVEEQQEEGFNESFDGGEEPASAVRSQQLGDFSQLKEKTLRLQSAPEKPTVIVSYKDDESDRHHHPPRLYSCSIQPNQTVTFAIPRRHVVIAGAQKSGTSAFYFILRKHPHLMAAKSLEPHFFDWQFPSTEQHIIRWMQERDLTEFHTDYFRCATLHEYFTSYFDGGRLWHSYRTNQSLITFEKTPSYLFLDRVPQRIYEIMPPDILSVKIVISLRHPVERSYSQFHSDRLYKQVPWNATFEKYLNEELHMMRRFRLTKAPNIPVRDSSSSGSGQAREDVDGEIDSVENWDASLFDIPIRITNSKFSSEWLDRAHWSVYRHIFRHNYFQRSMYAVQLRRWMKYFSLNQSLLVMPYELFLDRPEQVIDDILQFCQVSQPNYFHQNPNSSEEFKSVYYHHGGQKDPLALETRLYMERFLEPYNHDLAQLLQGITNYDWEHVWERVPSVPFKRPLKNLKLHVSSRRKFKNRDMGRIRGELKHRDRNQQLEHPRLDLQQERNR